MTIRREAMAARGRRLLKTGMDESGSTLPLIAFFALLALTVILLVASATSLYLERERLFTVADGAALAAAESFPLSQVRLTGGTVAPRLTDAQVEAGVDAYLLALPAEATASGLDRLTVQSARAVDGESATVTLGATWHPPVVSLLVPDGIRLTVTSVARSVFG